MQKLCINMWLMDLSVGNCARSVYPIGICYFESVPVYIYLKTLYFGFFYELGRVDGIVSWDVRPASERMGVRIPAGIDRGR